MLIATSATIGQNRGHLLAIEDGTTDLIAFGQLFIANPDLPRRLAVGGPFDQADRAQSFGGDKRGYIDYPALAG